MDRVVNAMPHFAKTMGRERTPPPITVAMRLNVPMRRVDWRLGEEKGGARWSCGCGLRMFVWLIFLGE